MRLVGIEYDIQKKEAAYRKLLVIAEDDGTVRPKTIEELFGEVRSIYFLAYLRYLYFNIGRMAYLQANVLSAYVFLAPEPKKHKQIIHWLANRPYDQY